MKRAVFAVIVGIAGFAFASSAAQAQFGMSGVMNRGMIGNAFQPKPKAFKTTGATKNRDRTGATERLSNTFGKAGSQIEQRAAVQEKAAIALQKRADKEAAKGYGMSAQALRDQAAMKMQKANADMSKGKALVDYSMKLGQPKTPPKR